MTNPLSLPTKVPFTSQKVTNTHTNTTATVNDPSWLKYFQNLSDVLTALTATISLGGAILAFQAPDSTWIAANGAAVSRTTYSDYFALVGTSYGAGNGTTTFNLPTVTSATGHLTWFVKVMYL